MALVDEHASEDALLAVLALSDGEVDSAILAILRERHNVATSANDLRDTRPHVVGKILVVLSGLVAWHEHLHILADHFDQRVAPELLRRFVEHYEEYLRMKRRQQMLLEIKIVPWMVPFSVMATAVLTRVSSTSRTMPSIDCCFRSSRASVMVPTNVR